MAKTKIKNVLKEALDSDRPGRAMSIHHLKDGIPDEIPLVETEFGSHSRGRRKMAGVNINPKQKT